MKRKLEKMNLSAMRLNLNKMEMNGIMAGSGSVSTGTSNSVTWSVYTETESTVESESEN